MANLRDNIGKEIHADYAYKKQQGKKNRQPKDGKAKEAVKPSK